MLGDFVYDHSAHEWETCEVSPKPGLLSWKIQLPYTLTHPSTCLVNLPLAMTSSVVFHLATRPLKPSLYLHLRPHISPTTIFIPFPCYEYLHSSNPPFTKYKEFCNEQVTSGWLRGREAICIWRLLSGLSLLPSPASTWRPSKNLATLSVKKKSCCVKGQRRS